MKINPKMACRLRLAFHIIGLSCLGGATSLQAIVFSNILQNGYFRAVETNPAVLTGEVALTGFVFIYLLYLYQRIIRHLLVLLKETS